MQKDIDDNSDGIQENADFRQQYFKDHMNFDAIQLIEDAYLEKPENDPSNGPWPLVVKINGNYGYTCNAEGTVDQHTADLLCQKADFDGASNFQIGGESLESVVC